MFFNPLEQFEILPFFSTEVSSATSITLLYTNFFEVMLINFSLVFFLAYIISYFSKFLPQTILQFLLESFGKGVSRVFLENAHLGWQAYIPTVFILTVLLLLFNLSGLVPFTFTVTSHLFVTFALSFIFFFVINFIGIKKHRVKMLSIFLPKGTPLPIMPFLLLIEFISYVSRLFSLAIRLFANLLSGHTLLKILSTFLFAILWSGSLFFLLNLIPMAIVLVIICMEMLIAFLQVYVFITLVSIYFRDIFSTDH